MIRFATEADRTAVRDLWDRCFQDEQEFSDWYFANRYRADQTLLSLRDDTLCAMVQMLPYQYSIDGCLTPVTYIYGACTDPSFRRQGLMAELLDYSFCLDQENGRTASVLIPAEPWLFDFYRRYGYETAFYYCERTVRRTSVKQREGTMRDILFTELCQINELYQDSMTAPYLCRTCDDWNDQFRMFRDLGGRVLGWYSDNGAMLGYAFVWINEDEVWAQELMCADPTAMAEQLMKYLAVDTIKVTTPGMEKQLGCIRWHKKAEIQSGYFNLLFN